MKGLYLAVIEFYTLVWFEVKVAFGRLSRKPRAGVVMGELATIVILGIVMLIPIIIVFYFIIGFYLYFGGNR